VRFEVAGAGGLPSRDGGFDVVVSGLALNFLPDASVAIAEQVGLSRPGGWIAACVWDYAEGMEFLRHFWDAAATIDHGAVELDEAARFPICNPDSLKSIFEGSGTSQVRVGPISVPTTFSDFDDYWRPFLGGTGPAPSFVAGLSAARRHDLEAALRRALGSEDGRSIDLTARAWAVVGRRS